MEMSNKNRFKKLFYKNHDQNKQSAFNELKDFCIYLMFLLLTTILATSSREIGMFYFNNTVDRLFNNRFTSNQHGLELAYEDLVTISDWWSFVETTFIEGIDQFGNTIMTKNVSTDGNVLLGPPRLRQIRVKSEPCEINNVFENKFKTCFGEYTKSREDVSPHLNKEHLSQSQAYTYSISGSITNYQGAGFIEMLDFDKENNENIIAELKDALWVDSATRIILIEFILFNSNVNLFCNAKFLAEIPPTGGIITSNQLQALKYSPLWNDGGYSTIFCSVVLFGLILYYTLEMVRNAISKGFITIFGSVFGFLDILVLLIGYSAVVYITWHTFYLKSILNKYEQDSDQFLSLDIIFYWNGLFIDQMGIFIFIVWIQIFKYTKFNKTMMQFITTLQRCAKDLIGFSIMFSIVIIAFALLAVLIFGSTHSDFCNFSKAILTLMRTVLGDFDFEKLEAANRILGPIFFISFILFVFFILMNMFLAIINDTYSDVKSEIIEERENQFQDYIKSLLEIFKRLIMKNSKDETSKKSDEQDPQVSRVSSEPAVQEEYDNYDTIIDKYFETISSEREDLDEDLLTERVSLLETKLENVIANLDDILNKYEEK